MFNRLIAVLATLAFATTALAGVEGYYRFPATNGEVIVFAAEGDLWKVPIGGGLAARLTTDAGAEAFPRFSHDGTKLAFSAAFEGNVDVYAVSIDRPGEPRRLTFHPYPDEVVSWTADGEVVFRSRRASAQFREHRLFTVSPDGGMPELINIGIATLAAFSPDGRSIAFNRISREFRTWKRYRGGEAQEIWIGDLERGAFRRMTTFEGTDRFPMWHDGRVYYLSDQPGRLNIFSCRPDGSDIRQHTDHERFDARWPDMHDGVIVYMYEGDLWLLDVASGRNDRIDITLPTDRLRTRPRFEDAGKTVEAYDLNADGSRLAIGSRGEIWNVPIKGGRTVALNETSGVRERLPLFAPDGESIVALSDESGEQEVVVFDAMNGAERRALTDAGKGWLFQPKYAPDAKHVAYADLTQNLFVVNVETRQRTRVDGEGGWEITDYAWSPDGKWLAYTKPFASWSWDTSIYLYNVETEEVTPVTTRFTGDHSPAWDPEGKHLYFVSSRRINPLFGERDFNHLNVRTEVPCAIILQADGVSPFASDEIRSMKDEDEDEDEGDDHEDGDDEDDDDGDDEDEDADEELPEVVIDLAGIVDRTVEFPIEQDRYAGLRAIEGKLFYMSLPLERLNGPNKHADGDPSSSATLHAFDLEEQEAEVILSGISSYDISDDGSKIAWRSGSGPIQVASCGAANPEPDESIDPSDLRLGVTPTEEWEQIYHEAWRLQRDFYWAENMAGIDWDTLGAQYAELLPRISTRHELNDLIGQLIGELGTSHTYVWGGDALSGASVSVGLLGADVAPAPEAGCYRIDRVMRPEVWETGTTSPLTAPHANVADGEYLFAINSRDLTDDENIHERLAKMAGQEVLLTVGPTRDRADARDVQITPVDSERGLRYRDWCRRKREHVDEQTSGRVGYFHLPDMGGQGLVEFVKGFYPQLQREGLIVDCRYNGGGFVSQMIIDRLARERWAFMKPRRGETDTYPSAVHVGPKAMVTNAFAGSDGDIGPESFQMRNLGPVIGERSWGGVVGIRSDKAFIDGGMSTQPEFAWWEPNRGWELENQGVYPDIVVEMLPEDYAAGRDPQLDRAIQHVMDELRRNPPDVHPQAPPLPDKSMRAGRR